MDDEYAGVEEREEAPRVVPVILGVQAAVLALIAVAVFAGIGVGSTVLRVGVGVLFLALAGTAGGIALSYSEGQPAARTAALVFEGFALALALLWFAPVPALIGGTLATVAIVVVARAQMLRPVPSQ